MSWKVWVIHSYLSFFSQCRALSSWFLFLIINKYLYSKVRVSIGNTQKVGFCCTLSSQHKCLSGNIKALCLATELAESKPEHKVSSSRTSLQLASQQTRIFSYYDSSTIWLQSPERCIFMEVRERGTLWATHTAHPEGVATASGQARTGQTPKREAREGHKE